jgi:ABC-type amino acid transport substrate-binding protein
MRRLPAGALATFLAAAPAGAADLPDIKAKGSLRVLAVVAKPEDFMSLTPGVGFDRELIEGFAGLHRLQVEVVPIQGWDALIPALTQGKGDMVAGRFTVTEARAKQIAFTTEVFPTRAVVVTRKPRKVVRTVEEFRAEKVGTIKGSNLAEAVDSAAVPSANVDDTLRPGTLPQALRAGRVTAIVLGVEHAIAEQREDPELQVGMFLGPPGSLAWGVRKGDTELLKALNEYIGGVRRTATWSRLVVKYFGEQAPDVLKKARQE